MKNDAGPLDIVDHQTVRILRTGAAVAGPESSGDRGAQPKELIIEITDQRPKLRFNGAPGEWDVKRLPL